MSQEALKVPDEPDEVEEENEDWHDREAEVYDHIRSEVWNFYEQRRIENDVKEICDTAPGDHVVDLGSGTGNLVLKFAEIGCKVDAVDISENMIEVLEEKISGTEPGEVDLHHAAADEFLESKLDEADIICFSSVLHHLPDYFRTLKTATEKLVPGGMLYVVHEPLPTKVRRDDSKLSHLDKLLTPRTSFHKWKAPAKDSELVDYHIDQLDGIDVDELGSFLESQGLSVVEKARYSTWKSGILSWIDDRLEVTEEGDFKLLARKETG